MTKYEYWQVLSPSSVCFKRECPYLVHIYIYIYIYTHIHFFVFLSLSCAIGSETTGPTSSQVICPPTTSKLVLDSLDRSPRLPEAQARPVTARPPTAAVAEPSQTDGVSQPVTSELKTPSRGAMSTPRRFGADSSALILCSVFFQVGPQKPFGLFLACKGYFLFLRLFEITVLITSHIAV